MDHNIHVKSSFSLFLTVFLVSNLFMVSQSAPSVHASQPFGIDGQANSSIPVVQITNSTDSNYAYMAQNNSQSYFKNDSKTSKAVRFVYQNYNFDMDISTSQLNYYNSKIAMLDVVGNPANPQNTVANVSGSVLTYPNAWTGTDLQYQTFQDELKETLIIHSIPSNASYADFLQYQVTCYYNSSLRVYANGIGYLNPSGVQFNTTGQINFNNPSTNATYYWLPQPFIYDSAGNNCTGNYGVLANNGILTVYIRIPLSFLRSAVFPVYLDPLAIDGSVAISTGASNYINLIFSTASNGDILMVSAFIGDTGHNYTVSSVTANVSLSTGFARRKAVSQYDSGSNAYYDLEEWSAVWASSGPINVTVTLSHYGSLFSYGLAFGISGADTTTKWDSNAGANPVATGKSTTLTVNINTSNANDMILGFGGGSYSALTVGAGYSLIVDYPGSGASGQLYAEDKTVSSTQTNLAVNFTQGASRDWNIIADAVVQTSSVAYTALPTFSVTSTYSELDKWNAKIGLAWSITSSYNILDKWTAQTVLTQSITSTFNELDKWTAHATPTSGFVSTFNVLDRWVTNSRLSQSITSLFNEKAKWTANIGLSTSFTTSWNLQTHNAFFALLSQTIHSTFDFLIHTNFLATLTGHETSAFNELDHWNAHARILQPLHFSWNIILPYPYGPIVPPSSFWKIVAMFSLVMLIVIGALGFTRRRGSEEDED